MTRARKAVFGVAAGALVGLLLFGVLVYRAVSVEHVPMSEARRRFDAVRSAFAGQQPLLTLDDSGEVIRREVPTAPATRPIKRLYALAYQSNQERLISANVPIWFFKIKGPAAQVALRDTGLDLARLRITADDLSRRGPGLVIDRSSTTGDRLIVWTE